jgi:hypothetical protein
VERVKEWVAQGIVEPDVAAAFQEVIKILSNRNKIKYLQQNEIKHSKYEV